MVLFPSFAAFIVVAAITYPLYEGTTAIVVSILAGLLTAVFVALGKQQQVKQNKSEQQQLVQATEQSTQTVVNSLQTYQEQLTNKVAGLAKQANASLMAVWENTQQQLLAENKEMKEKSSKLLAELSSLHKQQKELAVETSESLQQWLAEQNKVSQETFGAVQRSHQTLVENANSSNEKIEQLWRGHQSEQLRIRQGEQKTFNEMLAAVEAKEAAYSKHLEEQRGIFEAAQQQLKETLRQQAQLSHNDLLAAWRGMEEHQLTLRQQEHTHIMDTQKTVTSMIDKNTLALSDKIIDGWNMTRQSLEDLRKTENEHTVALLQTVEQANGKMLATLGQQQQTFDTAQSFYSNTYEQIKTYTGQLKNHEQALTAHHQQLIDTQLSIQETIAKTLNETLTQYTDVLTAAKKTLASSIEELKEQRAISEEAFGEFLEAFLEGMETQEQVTRNMVEHLQTEVSNLLDDSSTQLERAVTQMTRSAEAQNQTMAEIMGGSKEVLEQNQQVLQSLQAQTEETKATAKLLERAFKEVTTLNKNDMDILQRLMR